MANPMIQLLVLGAIALFLIFKLRGVLGTRDGFESRRLEDQDAQSGPAVVDFDPQAELDEDLTDHVDASSPAFAALSKIKEIEPGFSLGEFLSGARQAYEMILMAFERGDLSEVRAFLSPAVAEAFDSVIAQRERDGLTVEAQYLGTRETALASAEFDPATREAEVAVRFVGEMVSTTRDRDGKVLEDTGKVEGSKKSSRRQRDNWVFERVIGSADPNWRLVATGV